jgi:hypothetical protein
MPALAYKHKGVGATPGTSKNHDVHIHPPQVVSNTGRGGLVPLPQNADWVSGNVTLPQEGISSFDFIYYVSPVGHTCAHAVAPPLTVGSLMHTWFPLLLLETAWRLCRS